MKDYDEIQRASIQACPTGVYQRIIQVTAQEVDDNGNATLGNLARLMQDAAEKHLDMFGVTCASLKAEGLLSVVAKTEMRIHRLPRQGECILIRTWIGYEKYWVYPRRYELYSASGDRLVSASSEWLLIDRETRHLAPPPDLMKQVPSVTIPNEPKTPARRVSFPTALNHVVSRVVQQDEIDHNGHLNNAYYLDWAEMLPDKAFRDHNAVGSLWIEYSKEMFLGQEGLLKYEFVNDAMYLKGFVEGHDSFTLRIGYKNADF